MNEKWYAVYTKPRWEKKVASLLTKTDIENYCPLNKVVRKWSDRKKIIFEPLFTSYVFITINEKQQTAVRQTPGVINILYWLGKPAIIKEEEIITIKKFLSEYDNVQLQKTAVKVNDVVKIINGALMEKEGNVIEIKNKTIKVSLPSLGYLMLAEIEKTNVEVIASKNITYLQKSRYNDAS